MRFIYCRFLAAAALFAACLVLVGHAAWAQTSPGRPGGLAVNVWAGYLAESDVGSGQVAVASARARVSYAGFSFFYQRSAYYWDDQAGLPFGNGKDDPWETLQVASLGYRRGGKINQDWSWFGRLRVFSAFESEMDDSFGVGAMGGARYRINGQWSLMLGVAGRYHPVESLVLPMVGLSWNEHTPQGFSAQIGFPRSSLSYRFSKSLALHLKMIEFNQYTYRLADDSDVEPSGYVKVDDMIAGVQLDYSPMEHLSLEASLSYTINRTFTTYDDDGNNENEQDVDNAMGAMLRLVYRF
ncbi:MAG: hypothetical protein KQI62_05585 [Deltaproteobacteria bacterium]|nr:hypothetical protein [Deltaproteobacteria bacterium]